MVISIAHNFSKIPQNAPVRTDPKTTLVFDIAGALLPLYDIFLVDRVAPPDLPEWSTFWDRAQPILLTLGQAIDSADLGPLQRPE